MDQEDQTKQGWARQFMTGEPRLSEAVAAYEDIGFEVRLDPVDLTEEDGVCKSCLKWAPEEFKVIYTRPRKDDD
ncbi:MAG: hypothetical protein HQK56_04580 [Deltaproteobacteria bacterium]|nr:hypothetical protein [Deltaproteobacteria bacterium]